MIGLTTRMTIWKVLLLIYRDIDIRFRADRWRATRFVNRMADAEMQDGVAAFEKFPALVKELTDGAAGVAPTIVEVNHAITSITRLHERTYWPSPDDTRAELDRFNPAGEYDSVFVYWPQNDFETGRSVPSGGWGLGMGPSPWSNHATYATVANAPASAWEVPRIGEVWLHEWLHGVCAHFVAQSLPMPDGDADGAERHGYVRSAESGWCDYYRDLMSGSVRESGASTGIPLQAWVGNKPTSALA